MVRVAQSTLLRLLGFAALTANLRLGTHWRTRRTEELHTQCEVRATAHHSADNNAPEEGRARRSVSAG